jgi:hypothetical protein
LTEATARQVTMASQPHRAPIVHDTTQHIRRSRSADDHEWRNMSSEIAVCPAVLRCKTKLIYINAFSIRHF